MGAGRDHAAGRRARPDARPPDHHSPAAERQAWRRGCRDDSGTCACSREHHNRSTRQARQRRAEARFPASAQREFLRLVRLRMPVPEAAQAVGMTEPAVNGYARRNPQFAARALRIGP
ncbi:hypothetical protein IHE61_31105 [Streptomyces sp. GKU 257-1]|nr:hypothetical protein [Streptomyces sp. GKU 257-1]